MTNITHAEAVAYVEKFFASQNAQIIRSEDTEGDVGAVDVIFILDNRTERMTVWHEAHGAYGEW